MMKWGIYWVDLIKGIIWVVCVRMIDIARWYIVRGCLISMISMMISCWMSSLTNTLQRERYRRKRREKRKISWKGRGFSKVIAIKLNKGIIDLWGKNRESWSILRALTLINFHNCRQYLRGARIILAKAAGELLKKELILRTQVKLQLKLLKRLSCS